MTVSHHYSQGRLYGVTGQVPGLRGIKKPTFNRDSQADVSSRSEVCETPAITVTPDHWTLASETQKQRGKAFLQPQAKDHEEHISS